MTVIASLVPGLCLLPLLPSWSYPEVRLFADCGLGSAGGMLTFPGEEADGSTFLATSPDLSDYTNAGQLQKWESQFACSLQAPVDLRGAHSCAESQPILLCENLSKLTYLGHGDEPGVPFLFCNEDPNVACAPRASSADCGPWPFWTLQSSSSGQTLTLPEPAWRPRDPQCPRF